MATPRRTVKKAAPKEDGNGKAKILENRMFKVSELQGYYRNARTRDTLDDLEESIDENGQYKPIVINKGTFTGRPMEILVGNHTWLTFRRRGEEEIFGCLIDVGNTRASKINIEDNKSGERGGYDMKVLAEQIADLPDTRGISMSQFEIDDVMSQVDEVLAEAGSIADQVEEENQARVDAEAAIARSKTFDGAPLGEEGDPDDEDEDAPGAVGAGVDVTKAKEELGGMFAFKPPENLHFPGIGYWGIPKLIEDKLMTFEDLPDKLDSWAGSATKDWEDEEQWWLYNWGIDSTSGMRDIKKVIISFYAFDDYFDNWWWYPEKYVAKVINSGIDKILTPNFSLANESPRIDNMWNVYRARWLGRYFQEAGLKLCPDVAWRHGDVSFNEKHVLGTLPKNIPMLAVQMQTFDPKAEPEETKKQLTDINNIFKVVEPQAVLIYAGAQGRKYLEEGTIDPGTDKIRVLGTRQEKLSALAKGRKKKATI